LPQLTEERTHQEVMAFDDMTRLQKRLLRVATPVLKANTELCPKLRRDIGVRTHRLKTYPKAMRPAAKRELGAKDRPAIIMVTEGSPAQKSGLRIGDEILNKKNKAVSIYDNSLQDSLKNGLIRIRRGSEIKEIKITADNLCGYKLRLSQTAVINAYADGKHITLTSGMMNFVKSDDELALIIGHEMGHNTMGHIRKIIGNIILTGGATRYTRPFESEADYVGMYYMVRAGYSPAGVEDVWRRLALTNPKSVARAKTHPTYPNRYLRLAAARKEIESKQAAGEPLVPNFKTGSGKS
jgi:predicted Zn-dependent protease